MVHEAYVVADDESHIQKGCEFIWPFRVKKEKKTRFVIKHMIKQVLQCSAPSANPACRSTGRHLEIFFIKATAN